MIKIIKQEIKINHELKSKVEWACRLNNTKPHRAIINNKTYLLFNGHEFVYYKDLNTKIKLSDLKDFIKKLK